MRFTISILFLFLSPCLSAQNGKYIHLTSRDREVASIIWLSTSVDAGNTIVLKSKLFASFPIDESLITLLINGKQAGAKAEISSLFGNAEHEYTYERQVELAAGPHEFQIILHGPKEEYLSSVLKVEDKKVTILSDADLFSRIVWVYPDPAKSDGHQARLENNLLYYKAVIKTAVQLENKSCVTVFLNDRPSAPKESDILRKIGEGMYEFQGSVLLSPNIKFNELALSVEINDTHVRSKSFLLSVDQEKPSLYLLSIGTHTNLAYTAKDARDFADIFRNQDHADGLFEHVTIETLSGYAAETQMMRRKIEELGARMKAGTIRPKDLVVLFISSHGFLEDGELRIQGDDYDPSARIATSISFEYDVVKILEKMECKKLVFIDACHSGGGAKSGGAINYEIEKLNSVQSGLSTIVSSQKDEQSWEDAKWENGAFTEAIIAALQAKKADSDGNRVITISELFAYLKREVPKMVFTTKQQSQNPILLSDQLGDVAIFFVQ